MGDFNLLPQTESVRILEYGRRNLISDFNIPTTRSRLNPYYGTPQEQPHANFAFVTPGVQVESFAVPDIEVSDHLPMLMTIRSPDITCEILPEPLHTVPAGERTAATERVPFWISAAVPGVLTSERESCDDVLQSCPRCLARPHSCVYAQMEAQVFNPRTFENARPDGFPVLEIMPRPDRPDCTTSQWRQFVPLHRTDLIGEIVGPVASLQLIQRFRFSAAQQPTPIEAAYRFPLPGDAAITGVRVSFGETTIDAELAERKQAEQAYRTARDEGRQATLLTREAPDVFTLQVSGLKPDEDVTIRTTYVQLAHPTGEGWSLRIPLTTVPRYVRADERGSTAADGQPLAVLRDPGHRFTLDLTFEAADTIVSPTHALEVTASESRLRVRLHDGEVLPDRDCVLSWQPQRQAGRPTLQILRHQEATSDASCFLALVTPPAAGAAAATLPREIVLLIDHSGSMEGPKWEAADWAVQNLLAGLTPADSFNLGLFHSSTRWFARAPVRGDERTVRQAREFLLANRDSGGTELGVALEQALSQPRDAEARARHVVIVTDAQVSDSGRILALVEREIGRTDRRRVDVLCIDAAPNDGLANQLAERGGGLARFLTSDPAENDIASALDELLADWAAPILRNLALEINAPDVQAAGRRVTFDQARQASLVDLGDLPAGRAVWVAGRVQHGRGANPVFRLLSDSQEIAIAPPTDSELPAARPAVAALFGARRVLDIEQVQASGVAVEARLRQLGYDPNALLPNDPGRPANLC